MEDIDIARGLPPNNTSGDDAFAHIGRLQSWLDPLNTAHVECDGMSRVISALLARNQVEHTIMAGRLVDLGPNHCRPELPTRSIQHFWIELPSGHLIDYRARMWMGTSAPHGVFLKGEGQFEYRNRTPASLAPLSMRILSIMSGVKLDDYPPLLGQSPAYSA